MIKTLIVVLVIFCSLTFDFAVSAQTHNDLILTVAQANNRNTPPKIVSMRIHFVNEEDPREGFTTEIKAYDPDDDEISYIHNWSHNNEEIVGETSEVLDWNDEFKKGDLITLEVVPYDGIDEGVWKTKGEFTIPNSPPKITSQPEAKMEGGVLTYTVEAFDPDGDPIEYSLRGAPKGMTIEPATGKITWNFLKNETTGKESFTVMVRDDDNGYTSQILNMNIPDVKPDNITESDFPTEEEGFGEESSQEALEDEGEVEEDDDEIDEYEGYYY